MLFHIQLSQVKLLETTHQVLQDQPNSTTYRRMIARSECSLYLLAALVIASLCCIGVETKYCEIKCEKVSNGTIFVGYDVLKYQININKSLCEASFFVEDDCEIPPKEECDRVCQPRAFEKLQYQSQSGPEYQTIIKSCWRPNHSCLNTCVRKPLYIVFFSGSKYQQRVDVGRCVGPCQQTDPLVQCVPTKNFTKAIEGPNGFITQDVIKECSCGNTNCYRADYFESYTALVNGTTTEKIINVGRCIGSCPGVKTKRTCFPSNHFCLWERPPSPTYCQPGTSHEEIFKDMKGKEKSVPVIETCLCGSG